VSHNNITCHSHISGCCSIMSHDEHRKVVHRPCSSCISSVQNLMGTPLSSSCQLRLGVELSHLSYILTNISKDLQDIYRSPRDSTNTLRKRCLKIHKIGQINLE